MNKVWFITGATRGLGMEIAKAAMRAGHRVVATGRNKDQIRQALAKTSAKSSSCRVRQLIKCMMHLS